MLSKIIIADDHKLFRAGLISILKDFAGVKVIGEAENGESLLKILKQLTPDIVLLDLNMPLLDGYGVLEKLSGKYKGLKVIVLSMYDDEKYIARAIELGACGYLHKNADPDEIKMAIDSVREIGCYFNNKTSKAMLNRMVQRKKLKPVFDTQNLSLNDSELGVINCICQEMTSAQIATKLFLSPRSVEGIRSQLIAKTGSKNAVGLALWAAKNNLIDL